MSHDNENRRQRWVATLLARPAAVAITTDPCRPLLASLLAGRLLAEGVLPADLGLGAEAMQQLWRDYFPGPALHLADGGATATPEEADLMRIFVDHRSGRSEAELWLARILARACSGQDHLWQSLGLANRGELSAIMNQAFGPLAALNTGDMKWKKFLYRHYCQQDGIYVCPAPSCGVCKDYQRCFGPEDDQN